MKSDKLAIIFFVTLALTALTASGFVNLNKCRQPLIHCYKPSSEEAAVATTIGMSSRRHHHVVSMMRQRRSNADITTGRKSTSNSISLKVVTTGKESPDNKSFDSSTNLTSGRPGQQYDVLQDNSNQAENGIFNDNSGIVVVDIVQEEDNDVLQNSTSSVNDNNNQVVLTDIADDNITNSFFHSIDVFNDMPPQSIILLNLVAVIWGSQHPVIKSVIDDTGDPSIFSFVRFMIGAIIASRYTPNIFVTGNNSNNNDDINGDTMTANGLTDVSNDNDDPYIAWRWGIEMGLWMFLGYAFQAIGIQYTTAQRSGFLLYLNVKFVPFFARILFGKSISIATWISAITAFVGTVLLACSDNIGSSNGGLSGLIEMASTTKLSDILNIGDLWSIAAAAASAMFILRLESASLNVRNSAQLNSASLWVVTILSFMWSLVVISNSGGGGINASGGDEMTLLVIINQFVQNIQDICASHPIQILYLGGVTTALANYIQTKGQRDISAERASVIYAMDPVYGAIFSNLILGEELNFPYGIIGATLITIAAATNAFLDFNNNNNSNTSSIKKEKDQEE